MHVAKISMSQIISFYKDLQKIYQTTLLNLERFCEYPQCHPFLPAFLSAFLLALSSQISAANKRRPSIASLIMRSFLSAAPTDKTIISCFIIFYGIDLFSQKIHSLISLFNLCVSLIGLWGLLKSVYIIYSVIYSVI